MTKIQNAKQYDLEDRMFKFAKSTMAFCKSIDRSTVNTEIVKQLTRVAGSVGANYIEPLDEINVMYKN